MIIMDSVIETIIYILQRVTQADKIKLIKLVYLADKYHLAKYGRTITGDDYYAMEHGPVGSATKDVLSLNNSLLSEKSRKKIGTAIKQINNDYSFAISSDKKFSFNALSESDIESLDYVLKKFGDKNSLDLSEYTHKYPEWYKYKKLFEGELVKRVRIDTKELLSKTENDQLLNNVPDSHIKQTQEFIEGNF